MKFWCKVNLVLLTVVLAATPALGQSYPFPGKNTPVPCTGCVDDNKDLPTYPYKDPIVSHVGRYVDSSTTINVQHAGMRTVRARAIRPNIADGRVLIQLGETVGSYSLSSFFSTTLKSPMQPVQVLNGGASKDYNRSPIEKIAVPDSFHYPEGKGSGWETFLVDSQVNLNDFDSDDRGYVYVGNLYFGWGVGRQDGVTGGKHMGFVSQTTNSAMTADKVVSVKVSNRYFVVLGESGKTNAKRVTYDVTTPATPVRGVTRTGTEYGFLSWSKDESNDRVAVINSDGKIRIYDYASFANGADALATFSPSSAKKFADIGFDESGRLWAAEADERGTSANVLWRLSPSGSTYTKDTFSVYGGSFGPVTMGVGGGYIAVGGRASDNGVELKLLKLEGSTPVPVDTDNFFRKFYHKAPLGYASPSAFVQAYTSLSDIALIEYGNKTYLFYSAEGLGDVYEIEAGEGIAATMTPNAFGTANPNAKPTEAGPFYGDVLKFKATSNNPNATYTVDWNFGNPEAPTNIRQTDLGETIEHQYTGLTTAAKIILPKTVLAKATIDASIASEIPVNLKVPTARVGVPGLATPLTNQNKAAFLVVAGDKFTDASDGVIEGHFSTWTIDSVPVKTTPDTQIPVGILGPHELTFTASYGMYDETFSSSNMFTVGVLNVPYTVVPFTASIRPPTSSGNNFTFKGDARKTSDTTILSATQWTVTWTLTTAGATAAEAVESQETKTVNVGTIPDFVVPKSSVTNGSTVTLQVAVAPTAVPLPIYAEVTDSETLTIPDITVQKTGCTNASEPCKLTAKSISNASTAGWSLSWSIKNGNTVVKSGTENPISFTPSAAGNYTATVTETVFGVSVNFPFTVAAATCGSIAEPHQANPSTDCGNSCEAGVDIEFSPNFFGYSVQPCDTFSWDFGDNTPKGTTEVVRHKYTANGTYPVKFTLKNTSGSYTWPTLSVKVGSGGPIPIPCVAPTGITFTWLGSKGCGPNKNCEAGESVKFTALRGPNQLASCDTTQWNINGSATTTKSPSQTFSTTGTVTVTLIVSNTEGTSPLVSKDLNIVAATGGTCTGSVPDTSLSVEFEGPQSGCAAGFSTPCRVNEVIQFNAAAFGYTFQACDRFEWNFGDGSQSTQQNPTHAYTAAINRRVTLRVWNTNNTTGVTKSADVLFSSAPIKPTPELAFSSPALSGAKGVPVTFTVNSNINALGWSITSNDGSAADNSRSSTNAKQLVFTRTFTKTGTWNVQVTARNAEDDAPGAPTGVALTTITITDIPEYRYLLPVVSHGPGQNNSVWRTDVQIYNPDPQVSDTNQLEMTATFNGQSTTLRVAQSTYIFEDFMQRLTTANNVSGPVILSTKAKFAPQIWTRTYNQTSNGTFGQFIPAIRLDAAGGGSAVGEGKYYLAGLKNDIRYRTNLGFVNPGTVGFSATIRVYDDQGLEIGSFNRQLDPMALNQFPITHPTALPNLKGDRPFSVEIEVPPGQWLIGYASFIDGASNDPIFLQAIRASELASADYRDSFIPGVGHVGAWRSDVTIFNPNSSSVPVDIEYYDQTGAKKGEAKNVLVRRGEFLQYSDILKQGVFGNVPDSLGSLRVTVPATTAATHFPMMYARTYNDDGSGKTYGQGIAGFATGRANVKPGKPALIPGIRNLKDETGKQIYYTNIGLTNVSSTPAIVTVKVLDPNTGAEILAPQYTVQPYQSIVGRLDIGNFASASLKIEVTGANVWAFCSVVDDRTKDPEYVAASPIVQ